MDKKQELIDKLYIDAVIFEDDILETYTIDEKAKENYKKALLYLAEFKSQGLCEYEYDLLSKPLRLHCIYVQWKADKDGYIELNSQKMSEMLANTEGIVINTKDDYEWQLSATIYLPDNSLN